VRKLSVVTFAPTDSLNMPIIIKSSNLERAGIFHVYKHCHHSFAWFFPASPFWIGLNWIQFFLKCNKPTHLWISKNKRKQTFSCRCCKKIWFLSQRWHAYRRFFVNFIILFFSLFSLPWIYFWKRLGNIKTLESFPSGNSLTNTTLVHTFSQLQIFGEICRFWVYSLHIFHQ
jgi:hypothetical protein